MRRSGVRIPLPPPISRRRNSYSSSGDENAVRLVGRVYAQGLKSRHCAITLQRRSAASQSPYLHRCSSGVSLMLDVVNLHETHADSAALAANDCGIWAGIEVLHQN